MSYYGICACLHIMSNTYCVVFLLCFSSSCVPSVASFSGLSIFYCPFGNLEHLFTFENISQLHLSAPNIYEGKISH